MAASKANKTFLLMALVAAASCSEPSEQQNREMNEAERMLDEAENSLANIDENMLLDSNRSDAGEPEPRSDSNAF